MKRVLANHEMVAHVWANQSQPEGRGCNMFFENENLYSYGKHFILARFVEFDKDKCILFNSSSYSVSTGKHQSITRAAIDYSVFDVFTVPELHPSKEAHEKNKKYYVDLIIELTQKAKRAKKWGAMWLADTEKQIEEANRYANFFGLDWDIKTNLTPEKRAEIIKVNEENKRKEKAALKVKAKEYEIDWLNGETNVIPHQYRFDVLLRVKGDNVETSQNAQVPIEHAKRIFPIIKRYKDNNQLYVKNGHSEHIGHFTVDRIEPNGNIKVGCHFIKWAEIERISKQLGL